MIEKRTAPDESTKRQERAEASLDHAPDPVPTEEQEAAADRFRDEHSDKIEEVARHHKEMDGIGAKAKGEVRISQVFGLSLIAAAMY